MTKLIVILAAALCLAACGEKKLDDRTARAKLSAESIYVAEPASLEGVRERSLAGFIKLKRYCIGEKPLVVTGGTENGHAESGYLNHREGYKFDVPLDGEPAFSAELEKLIRLRTHESSIKTDETYTFWNESFQYRIRKEDHTHWDITVDAS